MRKAFKVLSFLLVICVVLSLGTVGCKKSAETAYETTPIDVSEEYTPLVGKQNDWLNYNPDRGYRTEMVVFLYDTAEHDPWLKEDSRAICVNDSEADIRKSVDFLMRTYLLVENKLTIAYIHFDDCNTADQIPQKYFDALDIYLETCKAKGIRVIWRHCYGHTTNKYIANKDDLEYL